MDVMPISESVKFFLKGNKDTILKNFNEQQIRGFSEIFDLYTSFFQDDAWYLTQIRILQTVNDVQERIQESEQHKPQQQAQQQTVKNPVVLDEMKPEDYKNKAQENIDEDIKALLED